MLKQQFPMHFFHAHGCAFGGQFTKPFQAVVESQAATSISSVGGHAMASSGPFNFKEIVRFNRASTQIAAIKETPASKDTAASLENSSYDTVVTCAIEGVNIFNQFTADEIVAHLSVKTSLDGTIHKFNTVGTRFVNLRVGGVLVTPVLVNECDNEYGSGNTVNKVFDMSNETAIAQDTTNPNGFLTSLIPDLKIDSQCVKSKGNALYVPDFGVVYLAEYLVTPHARQLNMFRIEFGCGVGGSGSGGGVGANGSTCPPPNKS
jgi:hypothetical protein